MSTPKGRIKVEGRSTDLAELTAQAIAMTPKLDPAQARLAVGLHRLLAEGDPVPPARLGRRLGLTPEETTAALADFPAVYYDDDGRVVGFWGLAISELSPTHRFEVDGKTLFAWCAADTLFLPRVIGKTARIASTFPTSGEPISLVVGPDRIESVSVDGAALSFVRPQGQEFDNNIISNFCHHILFFPTQETGRQWAKGRDDVVILTIEDGFELTRQWTDAVFGPGLEEKGDGSRTAAKQPERR